MAIRNIRRQASNPGAVAGTPTAAPIYVDSDDNKLKFIPAGSGTTEVEIIDASSAQTLSNKTISGSTGAIQSAGGVLTELTGDGAYSISVTLPAGSILVDMIITAEAAWTAATSATLIVGDTADDDGFFTAVNAKTTPAVGTSLRPDTLPGGTGDGAYLGDTNGEFVGPITSNFGRYYKAGSVITAKITKSGAGTAGRTQFTVLYTTPTAVAQVVV
jgi:hypothetical protein